MRHVWLRISIPLRGSFLSLRGGLCVRGGGRRIFPFSACFGVGTSSTGLLGMDGVKGCKREAGLYWHLVVIGQSCTVAAFKRALLAVISF